MAGYNFRHEIRASADGSFPKFGGRYEIRYLFTTDCGEAVMIQFFMRFVSK
jgi:hypothetical protein